jgi:hypothetical protein
MSGCFGYAVVAWVDTAKRHCVATHPDLAAECFAPQGVLAIIISVVFGIASIALVWLAVLN